MGSQYGFHPVCGLHLRVRLLYRPMHPLRDEFREGNYNGTRCQIRLADYARKATLFLRII
jgi:hypothetical protein